MDNKTTEQVAKQMFLKLLNYIDVNQMPMRYSTIFKEADEFVSKWDVAPDTGKGLEEAEVSIKGFPKEYYTKEASPTIEEMLNRKDESVKVDTVERKQLRPDFGQPDPPRATESKVDTRSEMEQLLKNEPINFFLSNVLRYLSIEEMKILTEKLSRRCGLKISDTGSEGVRDCCAWGIFCDCKKSNVEDKTNCKWYNMRQ